MSNEYGISDDDYETYRASIDDEEDEVVKIPVRYEEDNQNWTYAVIDYGNGVKKVAVF